ncbi:MAG: hypothetical protein ACYST6_05265 [Planctomycetota bacterium]
MVHKLGKILGIGHEKEEGDALIASVPTEALLDWCSKNQASGPAALAKLVPVFTGEKNNVSWHALARRIIDDYGKFEGVRRALQSNLWSFMSCGSRAPYYERRIALLSELASHPCREVRDWASANIRAFEQEKDKARQEAEEWEWG